MSWSTGGAQALPWALPRALHADAAPRQLHVAALPFPSPQGTQAALSSMLVALRDAGQDAALLTYAHGDGALPAAAFPLLRAREPLPYRSLRSGPSAGKLLADLALAAALKGAVRRHRPTLVVAHHVEAAALACALGIRPLVFCAHTDLGLELPSYAPGAPASVLAGLGAGLDRALVRTADAVIAVSPDLATRLGRHRGPDSEPVHYVAPPWSVATPIAPSERAQARASLGFGDDTHVLGYAGNLDRYQGWQALPGMLRQLNQGVPSCALLVATASDASELWALAQHCGVAAQMRVLPLADEAARRLVHAALDVAVVPRNVPGGLPMKLLDALARGVPCVVSATARAGLPLHDVVELADGDDEAALAAAARALLGSKERRALLAERGRAYVAQEHAHGRFAQELGALQARVAQHSA